jgi:SpoVK/Ycf46/Vps4 family AAA+-type ATPase
MEAKVRAQVAIVMRESGSAHLLVEDVVRMMRTRFPRDYARTKIKDLTRSVAPHVSAYRKKKHAQAGAAGAANTETAGDTGDTGNTGVIYKKNGRASRGDDHGDDADAEMIAADRATPKFNMMNQGMRRRYTSTKVPVGGGGNYNSGGGGGGGGGGTLAPSFSAPPTSSAASSALARGGATPPPAPKLAGASSSSSSSSSSLAKRARRSRSGDGGSRGGGKRQRSSSSKSGGDNNGGGGNVPGASSGSSFAVKSKGCYADLGGIETCMQEVRELIEYPLSHPEIYAHLGVEPPRGILLHGPPGCGKTSLANAIAGELGVAFLRVSAPEIVSGMSGQSEEKVRKLFEEAIACAPSLIFIDEIDAITPKRATASRGMERRIVAQLLTCMDSLNLENTGGKAVMVIGATNTPDSLDSALRRAGRFDREICMSVPDKAARERILQVLCAKLRLAGQENKEGEATNTATPFDYAVIAKNTPGFVGADLVALTKEAAVIAVNRIFRKMLPIAPVADASAASNGVGNEGDSSSSSGGGGGGGGGSSGRARSHSIDERIAVSARLKSSGPFTEAELAPLSVTMEDFMNAVKKVQPSAKREGFATTPDVTWDDIGALGDVRADLEFSIMQPIRNPERFEAVGLQVPAGVLLYGPPGCGKTMLAKAIAHESGANFISVKGAWGVAFFFSSIFSFFFFLPCLV